MNKLFAQSPNRIHLILLILILAIGLLLRLYGIKFGLPYIYDPDEPLYVSRAMQMLRTQDLNPHWFNNPGSTTMYSLSVLYLVLFAVGRLFGYFPNAEAFRALYHVNPTLVYLSGRLMILAFSLVCIILIYLIARRIYNRWVALLAAGLASLSPVLLEYSKIIRIDMQMTLFLLIAFWFCLNILERGAWGDYFLAGGLTGLAIATKYPAAFFIPVIVLAHFLNQPSLWKKQVKLVGAGLASMAGLLIGAPFLFPEYQQALAELRFEARPVHLGATGGGFTSNLIWYFQNPIVESFTALGIIFLILGIYFCLASQKKDRLLLVFFPTLFLILISFLNLRWTRWLIPALPYLAIIIAAAIIQSGSEIQRLAHSKRWAALWISMAIAIPALLLFRTDLVRGQEMSGLDTRTMARQWILENIPPGKRLLEEVYSPQLPRDQYQHFLVRSQGVAPLDLAVYPQDTFRPNFEWTDAAGKIGNIQEICTFGIDYVILSSMYNRYLAEKERYPEIVSNYQKIFQLGPVIYQLAPSQGVNQGPLIRVLKVENCP